MFDKETGHIIMDNLLEKERGSYVLLSTLQVEMVRNKEPIMISLKEILLAK